MTDFEPREYQKELIEKIKDSHDLTIMRWRPRCAVIEDLAEALAKPTPMLGAHAVTVIVDELDFDSSTETGVKS